MAFGSKKQAVIAKPSFKERLTGVKSMFKKAHEDASKLNTEMQNEIDNYKMLIASYEVKIEDVSTTQKETQEFMSNLEKFI
jgi:hypothetical protein